uniref:Uncharacterized protein n=1 Tax=Hyaloperonospora arabidopsidis (strain Emoy2) TaxID=559515 RepID=M4C4T0_HYAAE
MTFCDGREDDDVSRRASGWQVNGWTVSAVDKREQWGLFSNQLDEDEADEAEMRDLFAEQLTDVPLDPMDRLSWDVSSEGSSEGDEGTCEFVLPLHPLPLPVGTTLEVDQLQWGLVSPCSDTSSPRSPVLTSSLVSQLMGSEPELEVMDELLEVEDHHNVKVEEEVTATCDSEMCWAPDIGSVLSSSAITQVLVNPFEDSPLTEPAETHHQSINEVGGDCDEAKIPRRPSLLPRVPIAAHWRRPKARTCSGAGLAPMSLVTLKACARSVSRARNQTVVDNDKDDGDFSSDDEGYAPESSRCSVDEMESSHAGQWRRASVSFASRRLSVSVSMKPAQVTKHLQEAMDKLNGQLHLLRSGSSASTVMSEESYLESPAYQEVTASPTRASSICSDDATPMRLASACTAESDKQHSTRQQKLRAGVFKAAGLLNVVSAEAARKLKSRSFRARQKAASETEEEDSGFSSPYSGTLDI